MGNIIISGGRLRTYCEQESRAAFSEGYIGGIVVSLILGIIGIIIGALGLRIIPFLSTQNIFDIFVFLLVPLINIVFLAVLETRFSCGDV